MSDADRQRQLARDRKRTQRARERAGLSHYVVALDSVLVEAGLVAAGLLPEARADDRELAAAIFGRLLTKWLQRRDSVTRDNTPSKIGVDRHQLHDGRKLGDRFGLAAEAEGSTG